ncbi:MAG: Fic family protein [Deltaproteobacteria bacterium]|jgi:fido (protein-threonine AMPylation protein)|nr:Fic family protein [Deltaproteobacteria bacterium]
MPEIAHKWERITDLPENYLELSDPAFRDLTDEWFQARKWIKHEPFESFREKVMREWAIETGQVERLYVLDDNLAKTMIENGLDSVELSHQANGIGIIDTAGVIANHYEIINSLYEEIKQGRPLYATVIRAYHAAFVENQEFAVGVLPTGHHVHIRLLNGIFKRWPNNPSTKDGIFEYCPQEQVNSEMDRLLEIHEAHLKAKVPVDIEAAWLHHRFILIYPFQDGNGRMARALMSMEYIRSGFFPPVVTADGKSEYLDALQKADRGDLKPFVRHLSSLVTKKTFECIDFAKSFSDGTNHPDDVPPSPGPCKRHARDTTPGN